MKKLFILVFLSIIFFANAQTAKPMKEQTIEYIENTLKGSNVNFSSGENRNGYYEIIDIDFSGFVLTVTINMIYTSFDVKHFSEYVIDLKEIEKVDITQSSEVYFLNLGVFNSKKLIKCRTNSYRDGIKRPEVSLNYIHTCTK